MQFSTKFYLLFTLAIHVSAGPVWRNQEAQDVAEFTNQINIDIIHVTQFFETIPTVNVAKVANSALQDVNSVIPSIGPKLPSTMSTAFKGVQARLVDNNLLLNITF